MTLRRSGKLPLWRRGAALFFAGLLFSSPLFSSPAMAQSPKVDFRQNCHNCHTIGGGRLTGPDLQGVIERKDRDWLISFITDPNAKLDGGDPYAQKLLKEARGQRMTPVVGMTRDRASALLDMIEAEGAKEKSEFIGLQLSDRAFTSEDVDAGRDLFLGRTRLLNGGAACVSCHTVGGLGGLSGGRLAPDLTRVYERLNGRAAIAQWLSAPPTEQMKATFMDHPLDGDEIFALVGFLEHTAVHEEEDSSPSMLVFALLGLTLSGLLLALIEYCWRARFRAVRRPMVDAQAAEVARIFGEAR